MPVSSERTPAVLVQLLLFSLSTISVVRKDASTLCCLPGAVRKDASFIAVLCHVHCRARHVNMSTSLLHLLILEPDVAHLSSDRQICGGPLET